MRLHLGGVCWVQHNPHNSCPNGPLAVPRAMLRVQVGSVREWGGSVQGHASRAVAPAGQQPGAAAAQQPISDVHSMHSIPSREHMLTSSTIPRQ